MLPIETNLERIERYAIQRENENFAFRTFLKGLDQGMVDGIVHRLHYEIIPLIDCLECGNCCNSLAPRVNENEIEILAGLENIPKEDYIFEHLEEDKFDGTLFLKSTPCRYLEGKRCMIYEHRPNDCKAYPYTNRKGFVFRMLTTITNYSICPIVYNIMENLKLELNFMKAPD